MPLLLEPRAPEMRLSTDRTALQVNGALTLAGIPPAVFDYRLGNRSALEWVIDQYRVTRTPAAALRHDPSDPAHPPGHRGSGGARGPVSLEHPGAIAGLPPLA